MQVTCGACGHENPFDQPYAYHAGFANQGFLYDDAGTSTLIWSTFDPAYRALMPDKHPFGLDPDEHQRLEEALMPAPSGGRWRFSNPPRCVECGEAIGAPMVRDIYYLDYPGSVRCDEPPGAQGFYKVLRGAV